MSRIVVRLAGCSSTALAVQSCYVMLPCMLHLNHMQHTNSLPMLLPGGRALLLQRELGRRALLPSCPHRRYPLRQNLSDFSSQKIHNPQPVRTQYARAGVHVGSLQSSGKTPQNSPVATCCMPCACSCPRPVLGFDLSQQLRSVLSLHPASADAACHHCIAFLPYVLVDPTRNPSGDAPSQWGRAGVLRRLEDVRNRVGHSHQRRCCRGRGRRRAREAP